MKNILRTNQKQEFALRKISRNICHLDLDNNSPPPPDYTPVAAASKEAAELGYKLGGEQLAEAKRQYGLNTELARPIIDAQLQAMQQTGAQGQDYYEYMKEQQRPVERALNARSLEADASLESLAERGLIAGSNADMQRSRYGAQIAEEAATAGADQMSGYSRAINIAARQGARYGYSPEKLAAQAASQAGGQASAIAAATNQARNQATDRARGLVSTGRNLRLQDENLGWAKKLDVAGLYRGLPGASQGAYQTSIGAGSAALNSGMAPGQAYMSGLNQGAGYQMQGAGMGLQGQTAIMNSQAGSYNAGLSRPGLDVGGLLSGGARMYGAFQTGGASLAAG